MCQMKKTAAKTAQCYMYYIYLLTSMKRMNLHNEFITAGVRARLMPVFRQLMLYIIIIITIIIMLHFYRAIFLTGQVIQRQTYTSIIIKKYVKSITTE